MCRLRRIFYGRRSAVFGNRIISHECEQKSGSKEHDTAAAATDKVHLACEVRVFIHHSKGIVAVDGWHTRDVRVVPRIDGKWFLFIAPGRDCSVTGMMRVDEFSGKDAVVSHERARSVQPCHRHRHKRLRLFRLYQSNRILE